MLRKILLWLEGQAKRALDSSKAEAHEKITEAIKSLEQLDKPGIELVEKYGPKGVVMFREKIQAKLYALRDKILKTTEKTTTP